MTEDKNNGGKRRNEKVQMGIKVQCGFLLVIQPYT